MREKGPSRPIAKENRPLTEGEVRQRSQTDEEERDERK